MANVNTGELLNFQDYSPEHNGRSARIDVEAVHTNQYNNVVTNSNYTFEEPKTVVEEQETAPQSKKTPKDNYEFNVKTTCFYVDLSY